MINVGEKQQSYTIGSMRVRLAIWGYFFLMLMSFLDEFTKSILVARFRAAILRVSEEAKIVSTSCEKDLRYRSDNTLGSIFGVSALKDEELE